MKPAAEECPKCRQMVQMMGGKPMMHYERGTNNLCSGEQPACRACHEVPTSNIDVAMVQETGICYGCSHE